MPPQVCTACHQAPASFFCSCQDPEPLFCSPCFLAHTSLAPTLRHHMQPIAAYRSPGYYDRLQVRSLAITQVKDQALASVDQVDKAIEEFTDQTEEVMKALRRYWTHALSWMDKYKRELLSDVQVGLEELERTLADDHPVLTSKLGPTLRAYAEMGCTQFELFSYKLTSKSLEPQDLITLCCFPGQMPASEKFASVNGRNLKVYDVFSKETTECVMPVDVGFGGSYCLLNKNTILCFCRAQNALCLYDINTNSYTTVAAMHTPRYCPGLHATAESVYVFGGKSASALASCEKLSIAQKAWTSLQDMSKPRYGFTPCAHHQLVYLVDANSQSQGGIDTFNLASEEMKALAVVLPQTLVTNCFSTAIVADGVLMVLTNKLMGKWRLGSEEAVGVVAINRQCYSNCPPLVVGREVLFSYQGSVLQFDLNSYQFS